MASPIEFARHFQDPEKQKARSVSTERASAE
jgi:hypothetical protein